MLKYCTQEAVQKYIDRSPSFTFNSEAIAYLVNYFAEGALTTLSNAMYDNGNNSLEHNLAPHCRCMGCYEYQIKDDDDKVVFSGETLTDLVNQIVKGENDTNTKE